MKSWEAFKDALIIYLCQSEDSSYIQENGVFIAKSGINSHACNWIAIESQDPISQEEIVKNNFDCSGMIFGKQGCKQFIDTWAEKLGFKYAGRAPVVSKKQDIEDVVLKNYDNMRVERVFGGRELQDFFNVFAETRNISIVDAKKMFPNEIDPIIHWLYVAYYLDRPAGIFTAVYTKNGGFIVDASVKENFRDSNVLTVLAERIAYDASNKGIFDYSAIVTSQFSYNVVNKHRYSIEEHCDVWIKGGEK